MARTIIQPIKTIKDGLGDLQMEFGFPLNKVVDPENIVASDAHVRVKVEYVGGKKGHSDWYKVVNIPGLSTQQKTDLRTTIKIIRDYIHTTGLGATGTPDDV